MAMKCEKCGKEMKKTQTINASNSKFEHYVCTCGNKKQICIGVNK
jgi:lysyl-tRNA synthetase class I